MPYRKNVGGRDEQAKTRQGFRGFRGELMNVGVDYYNKVESKNTGEKVAGVISVETN